MDKMLNATNAINGNEGIDIKMRCPSCKKEHSMIISKAGWEKYKAGAQIQSCFPELNRFYREMLITQYCVDCVEKTFNTPAPGHEEAFGEKLGECEVCGAPIWSKRNITAKYLYKCKSCSALYFLKNETLEFIEE